MQDDRDLSLKTALLTTAYFAPAEYYAVLAKADKILLESCEHYTKQTYRNRCQIVSANGVLDLVIPVEKISCEKQLTRDVRISNRTDWQLQHWRSIEAAYNSSPFFEYYKDDLFPFFEKKWTFLWDFNRSLQGKVLELIEIQPNIELTTEYVTNFDENIVDLREKIHPKKKTDAANLPRYYQVFEQKFGFIPNLSIIDLLFNLGNEVILIIGINARKI